MRILSDVIIVFVIFLFINSCCDSVEYKPTALVTYSEYKDTFYVGDTIHVKIEADANYKNECGEMLFKNNYNIT